MSVSEDEPTYFEQVESARPEECRDCLPAGDICQAIAQYVRRQQISLGWARDHIKNDFEARCGGPKFTPSGWGSLERACGYDVPILEINRRRRTLSNVPASQLELD